MSAVGATDIRASMVWRVSSCARKIRRRSAEVSLPIFDSSFKLSRRYDGRPRALVTGVVRSGLRFLAKETFDAPPRAPASANPSGSASGRGRLLMPGANRAVPQSALELPAEAVV